MQRINRVEAERQRTVNVALLPGVTVAGLGAEASANAGLVKLTNGVENVTEPVPVLTSRYWNEVATLLPLTWNGCELENAAQRRAKHLYKAVAPVVVFA